VRTLYSESKYDLKTKGIFVYTPTGRRHFVIRSEALEFAEEFGRKLILDYMAEPGLFPDQVTINVEKKDIKTHAGEIPIETRLIFEGITNSDVYQKALSGQNQNYQAFNELAEQVNSLDCSPLDCDSLDRGSLDCNSYKEVSVYENYE
jgi:hypothetical protein